MATENVTEVTVQNQLTKRELFAGELTYAMRSEQHMWVATAAFVVDKNILKAGGGETTLLDHNNLRQVGVGCFVCEKAFDPRLLDRKCTGDPKGAKVRR